MSHNPFYPVTHTNHRVSEPYHHRDDQKRYNVFFFLCFLNCQKVLRPETRKYGAVLYGWAETPSEGLRSTNWVRNSYSVSQCLNMSRGN